MGRTSISFTNPNEKWIQEQIDSEEFTSKSEVVNDLIRKVRHVDDIHIEAIRAALIEGENSGMSDRTPDDIMADVIARKKNNGQL